MTESETAKLVGRFRRGMSLARLGRWSLLGMLMTCAILAGMATDLDQQRPIWGVLLVGMGLWMFLAWQSFKQARQASLAGALLAMGRINDAEANLRSVLDRFGLFRNAKLLAAHHLAAVCHAREEYRQGSAICREILRYRFGPLRSLWTQCRFMLADCLLMMDDVTGAYEAFRPVYDKPLSLREQLQLLPIQGRYELAAGHESVLVEHLPEKVRLAEMMDSPSAALTHALLAEACRRQGMASQSAYLTRRAWLYADLDEFVKRCPVIEPVVTSDDRVRYGSGAQ